MFESMDCVSHLGRFFKICQVVFAGAALEGIG